MSLTKPSLFFGSVFGHLSVCASRFGLSLKNDLDTTKDVVQLRDQRSMFIYTLTLKDTPLRSVWLCDSRKKDFFSKTYIFLLPMYLVYQNLFCGILICPLSIWQVGLKFECIY